MCFIQGNKEELWKDSMLILDSSRYNFSYMHNQTFKADKLSQLQGTAENGFKRLTLGEVQGLISDV